MGSIGQRLQAAGPRQAVPEISFCKSRFRMPTLHFKADTSQGHQSRNINADFALMGHSRNAMGSIGQRLQAAGPSQAVPEIACCKSSFRISTVHLEADTSQGHQSRTNKIDLALVGPLPGRKGLDDYKPLARAKLCRRLLCEPRSHH